MVDRIKISFIKYRGKNDLKKKKKEKEKLNV